MHRGHEHRGTRRRGLSSASGAAIASMGAAIALSACSAGMPGLAPGALPYQRSNAIVTTGFKETEVAPNQYRIEVVGNANTPRERLEKIAATRAAEIGTENRLGYFRIDGVELATRCEQYTVGGQRGGSGTEKRRQQHTVLTANVTYTKQPADPSYVEAKTAFPQYRAELDQDPSAPLPADPALSAQCS